MRRRSVFAPCRSTSIGTQGRPEERPPLCRRMSVRRVRRGSMLAGTSSQTHDQYDGTRDRDDSSPTGTRRTNELEGSDNHRANKRENAKKAEQADGFVANSNQAPIVPVRPPPQLREIDHRFDSNRGQLTNTRARVRSSIVVHRRNLSPPHSHRELNPTLQRHRPAWCGAMAVSLPVVVSRAAATQQRSFALSESVGCVSRVSVTLTSRRVQRSPVI